MIPIVAIIGVVKSGKTLFLEELVRELKLRNHRIGTLKHTSHTFDFDEPGKDSYRLKVSGSDIGGIFSEESMVVIRDIDSSKDFLKVVLDYFNDVDLLLIEGYKAGRFPKILVLASSSIKKEAADFNKEEIMAVIGTCEEVKTDFNYFGRFEIKKVADFLEKNFIKKSVPEEIDLLINGNAVLLDNGMQEAVKDFLGKIEKSLKKSKKEISSIVLRYGRKKDILLS